MSRATDDARPPRSPEPPDVRLVVADMDGTLLDAAGRIPATFWPVLGELRARGVLFSPASGRQCATLQHLFRSVSDGMVFIAENGTYVVRDGRELSSRTLRGAVVGAIVAAVRDRAAAGVDLGIVVCGKRSAYVERTDDRFLAEVRRYYLALEVLDDVAASDDEILKLAVFDFSGAEDTAEALRPLVTDEQLVVSGEHWADVMAAGANKGAALEDLQRDLGITPAQTMAFGDYLNDLEMLGAAEHSYAMANAHPKILEAARSVAPSNVEDGVVRTIRDVLGMPSAGDPVG